MIVRADLDGKLKIFLALFEQMSTLVVGFKLFFSRKPVPSIPTNIRQKHCEVAQDIDVAMFADLDGCPVHLVRFNILFFPLQSYCQVVYRTNVSVFNLQRCVVHLPG